MFFEQKKKITGLSTNHAFEQQRPVEHLSLVLFTPPTPSGQYEPYDITSLQNLAIMRHNLNRGFAVPNSYVQNMP